MTAQQNTGLKWALIATLISGFSVFLNALVVKGIDPLVHTTIKNSVAGMLILLVLLPTVRHSLITLGKKQYLQLVLIAIIGGSVPFYLFFTGLKEIGAVQGALIQKTMVLWVAIMALSLLKEKLSGKVVVGIGLLYASSLVYGWGALTGLSWGHGLVLIATLMWAGESILAKKILKNLSPNLVVGSRMILGSMILVGLLFSQNKIPLMTKLGLNQWLMLVGLGVVLFGYVMSWYRALQHLPATVVASMLVGATVITSTLQAIFINQAVRAQDLAQAMLVVGGIGLVVGATGRMRPWTKWMWVAR